MRPASPVQGVAFLMGNDSAGGRVLVSLEVTPVPVSQSPDELVHKFPTVFADCVVTRSRYKKGEEVDLSDSFLCGSGDAPQPAGGPEVAIAPNLENLTLFDMVLAMEAVDSLSIGFFF